MLYWSFWLWVGHVSAFRPSNHPTHDNDRTNAAGSAQPAPASLTAPALQDARCSTRQNSLLLSPHGPFVSEAGQNNHLDRPISHGHTAWLQSATSCQSHERYPMM